MKVTKRIVISLEIMFDNIAESSHRLTHGDMPVIQYLRGKQRAPFQPQLQYNWEQHLAYQSACDNQN